MSVFDILKEWNITEYKVIDEQALEEITLGSSILATGGGGDPDIGFLWARKVLEKGKDIVMIDTMDVPDDVLLTGTGCLGAPVVLTEKPPSEEVLTRAIDNLQHYMNRKVGAMIPFECGGVNSILAYAAAGEYGIPVVDADGMNRAFPQLQMTSWHTLGCPATPGVSCDNGGILSVVDTAGDDYLAEDIFRKLAMSYGGISWITCYPLTGEQAKATSVIGSQSIAWDVGRAVFKARREHLRPVEELKKSMKNTRNVDCYDVFEGKIVDINRDFGSEANQGFSMGKITMEGINDYGGKIATLDFQNEWLIVRVDGVIKCLLPDLIAIVDTDTGEPIRTDIMKFGYRGSIVLMPVHERMRTPKGIETFGPRAFGYDYDYVPVEELMGGRILK